MLEQVAKFEWLLCAKVAYFLIVIPSGMMEYLPARRGKFTAFSILQKKKEMSCIYIKKMLL